MWINREKQRILAREVATRPVVVLTGARQVGKSSLLKKMFPSYSFVTLDLPSEAEQAENDPEAFLARFEMPIIIDEVQYAPKLFRHLKTVVDKNRTVMGSFILTGSQKFTLMKEIADSLAGRASILELETLSYSEIRSSYPQIDVESIMLRGGFPELYERIEIDHTQFYRSYVATYLERDLKSMLNTASLRDFERFMRSCALRCSQVLNKSDLAKDIGISPTTANAWLNVLVASNQIILLEPWFSNKNKSLVKSPKIYFADNGLLAFFLNIRSVDDLKRSPFLGHLWENFVFSELRKQFSFCEGSWDLNFYRDRTQEVDFIKDRGGHFQLWECKWTASPSKGDIKNLENVSHLLDDERVDSMAIICRTPNSYPIKMGVHATNLDEVIKTIKENSAKSHIGH